MSLIHCSSKFRAGCFALLDDCDASEADPRSRLYTGYAGTLSCRDTSEFSVLIKNMQQALLQGHHAVSLLCYEPGAELQGIAARQTAMPMDSQVLLFTHCQRLSADQVSDWLNQHECAQQAGITRIRSSVNEAEFNAAIARIHTYIEAGDTYQINYTYRLRFDAFGAPHALYRRLRARQPVPYGALIMLPDGRAVLSLSPELFVRQTCNIATAQPMKGTAAAGADPPQDAANTAALAADPKNRAENLMIVDLLRNDLGRIAVPGSVVVPALFKVKRFSSVLQMTSTIQARLRDEVALVDVLAALFPCGSITGAPKRRAMQIIRELEPDARGLFTGAIGWFDAPDPAHRIGDFCLSVPIRTLVLQAPDAHGMRAGEMGVGAGIVHDSVAAEEYAECLLKARFLTGLPNDFELFETMYATRDDGCRHLDLHLQRLYSSASRFGFQYDEDSLRANLQQALSNLSSPGPHRLRLILNQTGTSKIQSAELQPLPEPVKLLIAPHSTVADDVFLRHKSSVRERYDTAWREAEAQGGFDMLFCNEQGELTEGSRSNLFIKLGGRWRTPPLSAGVLPGIMRAVLLADPGWNALEQNLTMDDLRIAEEIVVCNALRGPIKGSVSWPHPARAKHRKQCAG